MIDVLLTSLGPASLLAVIYATVIYMNLSRRLGMVTKMPPYHRGFVVAIVLIGIAFLTYVARNAAFLADQTETDLLLSPIFGLFFFHVPLSIGIAIDIAIVWRYWAWLLKEKS